MICAFFYNGIFQKSTVMKWAAVVPMVAGLVAMVTASAYDLDPEVYNDLLVQDLYKRLALIEEPELRAPVMPDYYYDEVPYQVKTSPSSYNFISFYGLKSHSVKMATGNEYQQFKYTDFYAYLKCYTL